MKRIVCLSLILLACGWAAVAANFNVVQKHKQFSVQEVTVHAGDSVTFQNRDTVTHHLFSNTPQFSFNVMDPEDQDKVIKFPVKGDYEVRCAIHPNMKLMVHVLP